jgi:hypothetical protein
MGTNKPIDLERERGIREGARLLTGIGIPNADALSREMQEDVERWLAERECQFDAGFAEGEREGPA